VEPALPASTQSRHSCDEGRIHPVSLPFPRPQAFEQSAEPPPIPRTVKSLLIAVLLLFAAQA